MVLDKTPESPLDCKEIKPVNPKGNWPWIFTRRTDTEAEAPLLWPPDGKSQHIRKDPDGGKDWGPEEKGVTEDEMDGITDSTDMSLRKLWVMVIVGEALCTKNKTCLSNWTRHFLILLPDDLTDPKSESSLIPSHWEAPGFPMVCTCPHCLFSYKCVPVVLGCKALALLMTTLIKWSGYICLIYPL